MNYREKIRKAIECPQFGDDHYGMWGALRIEQRKLIKRLLDELDGADEYIKFLYQENQSLRTQRHKVVNYIKSNPPVFYDEYLIDVETLLKNEGTFDYIGKIDFISHLLELLGQTTVIRDKAVVWKEEAIIDEEKDVKNNE